MTYDSASSGPQVVATPDVAYRLRNSRPKAGYGRLPRALIHDKRVSNQAKLLYTILDDFTGDTPVAWPRRNLLAELMSCSVDSLTRYCKELQAAGWLSVETQFTENGRQTTNLYVLEWDSLTPAAEDGEGRTHAGGRAAPMRPPRAAPMPPREANHRKQTTVDGPKRAPRRSTKTPIPEGFVLTPELRQIAKDIAPGLNVTEEFDAFKDSAVAHGRTYVNWTAAWRQWVRNTKKFDRSRPPAPKLAPEDTYAEQMRRRGADEFERLRKRREETAARTPEERLRMMREGLAKAGVTVGVTA